MHAPQKYEKQHYRSHGELPANCEKAAASSKKLGGVTILERGAFRQFSKHLCVAEDAPADTLFVVVKFGNSEWCAGRGSVRKYSCSSA